jgi:DNA end-binding protein Ku
MAMEGYVVIRDALRKTGKIELGQLTIGGREWLVPVAQWHGKDAGGRLEIA